MSNIEIPFRMMRLPRDPRRPQFPVPFFVEWIDGLPDFRVIDGRKLRRCVKEKRCWLCGGILGSVKAFVIGPMCAVNRVSSEPPSHRDCAVYAARVCPFLSQPKMRRNEKNLPDDGVRSEAAISRNPGAALVWMTKSFQIIRGVSPGEALFKVGPPLETLWFAEGREATRAEIMASIESGLPILRESAEAEGPAAVRELERLTAEALLLVPGDVA